MKRGLHSLLAVAALFGCDGGPRTTPVDASGLLTYDAAMLQPSVEDAGPTDAMLPDAGPNDAGPIDAGPPEIPEVIAVPTNLPGAVIEQPLPAPGEGEHGLRVHHVDFQQHESGSLGWYTEWFAEVHNHGTRMTCFIRATLSAQSASGVELLSDSGFARGRMFERAGLVDCVGPGEDGFYYANGFETGPTSRSSIARVRFTLTPTFDDEATEYPEPPVLESVRAVDTFGTGDERLEGRVRNGNATHYSINLRFFVRNGAGTYVDFHTDSHNDALYANATYDFQTLWGTGAIAGWYQDISFRLPTAVHIDGPGVAERALLLDELARHLGAQEERAADARRTVLAP